MRCWPLGLVLVLVTLGSPAGAADLYVNNVLGSDDSDGRAPMTVGRGGGGPVRTLTRALELAAGGDHIHLANTQVPYRESVTLFGGRHSGTFSDSFVIEGHGAVLDGTQPVPPRQWENFAGDVFRYQPPRMAHAQLFRDGQPLARRHVEADGQLPKLEPLQWCLAGGVIYFRVEKDMLPDEYALSYAALPVGITLYQVRDAVIYDLTVHGYQLDGVNAHDSARECALIDITAQSNGRAGITVAGASKVELINCQAAGNGVAQLWVEGVATAALDNCQFADESAPAIVKRGGRILKAVPPAPPK